MRNMPLGLAGLAVLLLAGCKGAEYKTAPVKGKVTSQGKPVTTGQIFFHPIEDKNKPANRPGKAAFANLEKDGSFQLSTYGINDGAVVGRHRVSYEGPDGESEEGSPAPYLVPEDKAEVEVVAGQNEINIELVANPDAAGWKPRKTLDN